jgi:hypothetical protein
MAFGIQVFIWKAIRWLFEVQFNYESYIVTERDEWIKHCILALSTSKLEILFMDRYEVIKASLNFVVALSRNLFEKQENEGKL